jgi:NitT/TauT family transport system substrate-binding protein
VLLLLMVLPGACSEAPAGRPAPQAAAAPAEPLAAPLPALTASVRPPERDRIRVAYGSVSGSMAPLWIAAEEGIFSRHGLSVDLQYVESSVGVTAALTGDAQVSVNEGVSVIRAIAAGSPLRIVAYFHKSNPYAVVARPEIAAPAELRGKTIALLRPGDTTDVSARIALRRYGLVVGEDVHPLTVGNSPSRLAALLSGQVAAALLSEAFVDQALAQGMQVLISLEKERLPYVSTAILLGTDFGRENPRTVIAFLKGMIEATRYFAEPSNRGVVLPIMAQQLKLDPSDPLVAATYDFYHDRLARDPRPERDGVETILETLRVIDPAAYAAVTVDDIVDASYMETIQASGFLETIWGN